MTTAVGFVSLTISGIPTIREFGLFGALGIGYAYLGAILFLPIVLAFAELAGRASAVGGLYELGRRVGPPWVLFSFSWIALGGFIAVANVLARASADLGAVIARLGLGVELEPAYLVVWIAAAAIPVRPGVWLLPWDQASRASIVRAAPRAPGR